MDIAFFTLSPSGLYASLIDRFAYNGHHVTIICPDYKCKNNYIKIINEKKRILFFKALPLSNVGILQKGIADIMFPHFCKKAVSRMLKNFCPDLIISTTPPLGFNKSISYLKIRNNKCKYYLILRDIWPEAFKLFDFDKRFPIIYKWYRKQESKLYELADIIGCMSEGNVEFVHESNPEVNKSKLRILPNWADVQKLLPGNEHIKTKYGLNNKIVFIYGGNMSIPQGMDNILNLAKRQIERNNVIFLLIGKGTEVIRIKKVIEEYNLTNIKFIDYLPKNDYEDLLRISDVGLISLNNRLKTPSIPSKTLSYWNLGKPIFAIIDSVTDYGVNIIDKSKSGLWELSSEIDKIDEKFDLICRNINLRRQMGKNGRLYLEKECNTELIYNKIIEHIHE